jgi:ABC-type antimicrobial peptide transport system permease subunit
MSEKKKILYNTIFDMYKIFVGYCVVFLGATILQTSSGSINIDMGITLIIIDLIAMLIISWLFVPMLYSMYRKL